MLIRTLVLLAMIIATSSCPNTQASVTVGWLTQGFPDVSAAVSGQTNVAVYLPELTTDSDTFAPVLLSELSFTRNTSSSVSAIGSALVSTSLTASISGNSISSSARGSAALQRGNAGDFATFEGVGYGLYLETDSSQYRFQYSITGDTINSFGDSIRYNIAQIGDLSGSNELILEPNSTYILTFEGFGGGFLGGEGASGTLTLNSAFSSTITAVPEPSIVAIIALGITALLLNRRLA